MLAELSLPVEIECDMLVVELTQVIKIIGLGMTAEHRDEWVDAVATELEQFPWNLVQPAIARKRRVITRHNEFLAAVIADVETDQRRLTTERRVIEQLIKISED